MNEHIRSDIQALIDRKEPITLAEYKELRVNSWEQEGLIPRLDNEALLDLTEIVLKNCRPAYRRPCAVYDQFAIHVILPELLRRLWGVK
jgi:hypothetical protein